MIITVNGEKQTLEGAAANISYLLVLNKVNKPDMVSVQINGLFVDKKDYETRKIVENDAVDFLYFMGGGQVS